MKKYIPAQYVSVLDRFRYKLPSTGTVVLHENGTYEAIPNDMHFVDFLKNKITTE